MADFNVSFDSPKTSTLYTVTSTGVITKGFRGYLTVALSVSSTASPPVLRAQFRRSFPLSNLTTTDSRYNVTNTLTVVPKKGTGETVKSTWGLSETP